MTIPPRDYTRLIGRGGESFTGQTRNRGPKTGCSLSVSGPLSPVPGLFSRETDTVKKYMTAVGRRRSMEQTFGSTCHGAGRRMSRSKAKKEVWGEDLRAELEAGDIRVRAGSMAGLAEEAPLAYKDVDSVVEVVHNAGIAKKLARLKPVAVIKG